MYTSIKTVAKFRLKIRLQLIEFLALIFRKEELTQYVSLNPIILFLKYKKGGFQENERKNRNKKYFKIWKW